MLIAYRSTPHPATGVAPYETLKGTPVRMKLDYIEPKPKRDEKDNIIDRRDAEYKLKMKQQREGRKPRENNLLLGDYVLVKQPRKNKWSTPFEPVFYVVCSIRGSQVTARRVTDGRTVCRDASQFKLANAVINTTDEPEKNEKGETPQAVPDIEIPEKKTPPTEEFSTDACPIGGGGIFQGDWFYVHWATNYPNLANVHINLQETFTVLIALERLKDQLRDKWIIVRTDNTTTLSAINKGTCSNQLAMQWLQKLFWLSATYNFRVTSRYIPTAANTLADAISHLHDPAHCALLVNKLISCPLNKWPCVTPHLSRNAFHALPFQVQSMLRNNNLMPS